MLRIHVCEDNEEQRERIKNFIQRFIGVEELDMELGIVAERPEEMLAAVEQETVTGLFFLDIDLQSQMNGMDLARKIREYQPRCFIVFVTTHSEMSYMTFSYKVEAMDFIIKDNYDDMENRIRQCLLHAEQLYQESCRTNFEGFTVRTVGRIQEIPYDDILFFEVSSNSHKVVLHGKTQLMEFQGRLKEVKEKLDERFYQCHRAYIVNKDNISEIKEAERVIIMAGGESCPMSVRLGRKLLK